jgi:ribosome maturation factor RimP
VSKDRVIDIVEQLALPISEQTGVELVDIEYKKEGANWFLRVFIDKAEGIDIEDCSRFSEQLSARLDDLDPIPTSYFLEVSSPGAERPLKKPADYDRAVGQYVHVSLYEPMQERKVFEGTLTRYEDDVLEIAYMDKNIARSAVIPKDKIASARLAVQF